MAELSDVIAQFFEDNLILIMFIFAIPIVIIYAYRILRKIPVQIDYIKVFKDEMMWDERFNKVDRKFGIRTLWRGRILIGKVVTVSEGIFNVPRKSELVKIGRQDYKGRPIDVQKEKLRIFTLTFKPLVFNYGIKFFMGNEIIKFSDKDDFIIEDKGRLIFSSDTAFNALGKVYATANSYQQLSSIILDNWNKNLLQANTNLMSSEMSKISAQTPAMSHELSLKRLEIEKIRAEKQMKIGQII